MRINKEVEYALKNNLPVVALESTIISHGMPYPKNVETAMKVEAEVRENGAIPATIGIIDGEPVIGMSPEEMVKEAELKKYLEEISQLLSLKKNGVRQLFLPQ